MISFLDETFFRKLGQYMINRIREDMSKGISQNPDGSMRKPFYNPQYAKYKINGMKRYTFKKGKKTIRGSKVKINKRGLVENNNKNISQYNGQSISSRETSFVNLELTGKLKQGLKIKESDNNSVTISYNQADIGKILGAEKEGRSIVGLNDKNIELAKEMISKEISRVGFSKLDFNLKINVTLKI